MKKSEFIQQLINIEEKVDFDCSITMNYIHYLKKIKKLVEQGDIELGGKDVRSK